MSWGLPANTACSLVNTIIDTSGIWALTPLATSIIKYTNNSPVRHLPQQKVLFQLGASRNLRSPMGSRSNIGLEGAIRYEKIQIRDASLIPRDTESY